MKYYLFFFLITSLAFSQKAFIKKNQLSLDLTSKDSGRCKYTRNQLNKAQLNNIYGTGLRHPLKNTSAEYIKRNFNCIFIKRNLRRDSNKIKISPKVVFDKNSNKKNISKNIKGKIKYLGIIPKKYKYTISKKDGKTTISVKVFFKLTNKNLNKRVTSIVMRSRFKAAESIWESGAGSGYNFEFDVVDKESKADFTIKLTPKGSRGPYDKKWSLKWDEKVIAHELGHMMGLDDEYDNALVSTTSGLSSFLINKKNKLSIKKKVCGENHSDQDIEMFNYFRKLSFGVDRASKCDKSSIMCDHIDGKPKKWHIYTILKRSYL